MNYEGRIFFINKTDFKNQPLQLSEIQGQRSEGLPFWEALVVLFLGIFTWIAYN